MTTLTTHAAWTLVVTFALSLLYEVYRGTVKNGTSRHDSPRALVVQGVPFYGLALIVIALLFWGHDRAAWVGLVYCVVMILVSIFYYNPKIMMERRPGLLDWFEDLVYTGLLFVAAALLLYEVLGMRLA